jgi:hypothetical protein
MAKRMVTNANGLSGAPLGYRTSRAISPCLDPSPACLRPPASFPSDGSLRRPLQGVDMPQLVPVELSPSTRRTTFADTWGTLGWPGVRWDHASCRKVPPRPGLERPRHSRVASSPGCVVRLRGVDEHPVDAQSWLAAGGRRYRPAPGPRECRPPARPGTQCEPHDMWVCNTLGIKAGRRVNGCYAPAACGPLCLSAPHPAVVSPANRSARA